MLGNTDCKLESMNGAAIATVDRLGIEACVRDPEAAHEHCLQVYADYGAATGPCTPERVDRARESLRHFTSTYDPGRCPRLWFDVERDAVHDAGPLVDERLTDEALAAFNAAHRTVDGCGDHWNKGRTYVTRRLLRLALCCVL